MPAYTVRWLIDVDADTPEHAARLAAAMVRDPQTSATIFDVADEVDIDRMHLVPWLSVDVGVA